ncbi:MAG: hypothetical protein KC503_31375 [Myxococcales bacterium]|nr:hypothetical protein [Myxococcales bacterium]
MHRPLVTALTLLLLSSSNAALARPDDSQLLKVGAALIKVTKTGAHGQGQGVTTLEITDRGFRHAKRTPQGASLAYDSNSGMVSATFRVYRTTVDPASKKISRAMHESIFSGSFDKGLSPEALVRAMKLHHGKTWQLMRDPTAKARKAKRERGWRLRRWLRRSVGRVLRR